MVKKILKNYKGTLLLLLAIVIGGIAGIVFGPKAAIVKPFGDLFLNLMFTIIVPLVFFSIASAIANMNGMKRLGKIMGSIFLVFILTATVSAIIGFIGTAINNPLEGTDTSLIKQLMDSTNVQQPTQDVTFLSQLVNTFTVSDFQLLFSKSNMLQLIVFSLLFGLATAMVGERAKPVANLLSAASSVIMKVVSIIMYYAPIGLSCYFATIIGELGPQILEGYLRAFVLYIIITVLYYFGFFTLYAFIAGG